MAMEIERSFTENFVTGIAYVGNKGKPLGRDDQQLQQSPTRA
jgi:hypothetical protein